MPIPHENEFDSVQVGNMFPFYSKLIYNKNFVFPIETPPSQSIEIYFKIISPTKTSFIIELKAENNLIRRAEKEYFLLGTFYGILFIMLISNLVLYLFTKERSYLFYCFYVLSASVLFLTEDGLGFHYVWPQHPQLNNFLSTFSPILILVTFSIYAYSFLEIRRRLVNFKTIIYQTIIVVMIIITVYHLFFNTIPYYLYLIPYLMIYFGAIKIYRNGYRPAIYYIIAHFFIIIGLTFLIFRRTGVDFFNNFLSVYSLNYAFIIEISLLSYALGEKFQVVMQKTLRAKEQAIKQLKKKQTVEKKLVIQLQENEKLAEKVNRELENLIAKRTIEINEKKKEIELQNDQLVQANEKLQSQAEKINNMNRLLDMANWNLKKDIKRIEEERVLSKEIDFKEFSKIFPSDLACLKFIAEVKWENEFFCTRCDNSKYSKGKTPYSRRCTKCRYEESPTTNTLLHKCKLPLTKAFYAVFLVINSNGKISSQQLSETLDLRQSTCWNFSKKVQETIKDKSFKQDKKLGWASIIFHEIK